MIKYLVFKNDRSSGKSNVPGSPEDIACEIAGFVEGDGNPRAAFIAYPSETPEATFATLKLEPRFAIPLDAARMNVWLKEVKPLIREIEKVAEIVNNAYADITEAMEDLALKIQFSPSFEHIDIMSDVNIDSAFDDLGSPSKYDFSHYVSDYFEVKLMDHSSIGS